MRFVIGCTLSLIFSANCAYAMAPVKKSDADALSNIDYGKIVDKAILAEQKEKASAEAAGVAKAMEIAPVDRAVQSEKRRAIILPSHRTMKALPSASAVKRGEVRSIELPPSTTAEMNAETEVPEA
jgi:hypothetical protein